jgi:hypothetical protein
LISDDGYRKKEKGHFSERQISGTYFAVDREVAQKDREFVQINHMLLTFFVGFFMFKLILDGFVEMHF